MDRRADIWAFGAVLFEMLSGMRAFRGEDVAGLIRVVLAAYLEAHPDSRPGAQVRVARFSDQGTGKVDIVGVAAETLTDQPAVTPAHGSEFR